MVVPSLLTAGGEYTAPWSLNDHFCAPVEASRAYTLVSCDPTKMVVPSLLTAGDEVTAPSVGNDHFCIPPLVSVTSLAVASGRCQVAFSVYPSLAPSDPSTLEARTQRRTIGRTELVFMLLSLLALPSLLPCFIGLCARPRVPGFPSVPRNLSFLDFAPN